MFFFFLITMAESWECIFGVRDFDEFDFGVISKTFFEGSVSIIWYKPAINCLTAQSSFTFQPTRGSC